MHAAAGLHGRGSRKRSVFFTDTGSKDRSIKIHQRGMQWKQGVVILLYNTTPIRYTALPLHPPVRNTQKMPPLCHQESAEEPVANSASQTVGIHQRGGAVGGGVQWMRVVLYNTLVYNII